MQWLNEEELRKYGWYGGGNSLIDEFKGRIENDTSMLDEQITNILELETGPAKMFFGDNIKLFFDFLKKDSELNRFIKDFPEAENKFYLLNKVRVFAAHGISYIDNQTGELHVLIKTDKKTGESEGLVVDEDLIKEVEDLTNYCFMFVGNVEIELGYHDTETEEFHYPFKQDEKNNEE